MKSIGTYDASISVRERLYERAEPFVVLHLHRSGDLVQDLELTPAFARTLARHLKQYADIADPPKTRKPKP